LDGVIPTTLSKNISNNTKALPVRIIDALDLKSKKTDEIKTGKYSSVYIELPESTRTVIDNLLHDNLKYFFDDLFNKNGGVDDIYKTLHNIYELIGSGKFGGKKEEDSWWKKILPFLPEIAAVLAGLAAGLGEIALDIAAAVLGFKALKALFKPLVEGEGDVTKNTPETDAERTAKRAKEEEKRLETEKKLQDAEKQLRDQEIADKEADIKRLEDLIKKKENSAKELDNIEEELRTNRTDLEADLEEHLKEIDKIDKQIESIRAESILSGNENTDNEIKLLERRRTAFEEESKLMKDGIEDVNKNIKAITDDRELAVKQLEELKKTTPAPEPEPAPEPKLAPEPTGEVKLPTEGSIVDGKYLPSGKAVGAVENTGTKSVLKGALGKVTGTALGEWGPLGIYGGAIINPTSFGPEIGVNKQEDEERIKNARFSKNLEDLHYQNLIKDPTNIVLGNKNLTEIVQGVASDIKYLFNAITGRDQDKEKSIYSDKEIKEATEKTEKEMDPNYKINEEKKTMYELGQYIKGVTAANIQPVDNNQAALDEIKQGAQDRANLAQQGDILQAQLDQLKQSFDLSKRQFELQYDAGKKQDDLIKAFRDFKAGNSVNIVSSSSTSINSQQSTTPATRSAFSNRSYGQ